LYRLAGDEQLEVRNMSKTAQLDETIDGKCALFVGSYYMQTECEYSLSSCKVKTHFLNARLR